MWQILKEFTTKRKTLPVTDSDNDPNEMDTSYAVGIDLGTTFSCVAVYRNGFAQIIPNSQYGDHLTPSVVFYDPNSTDVSIGKYADEWGIQEKTNLIYDVKRLMGRKYDDIYVRNLIKNGDCSYKIVRGKDDKAEIEIKQDNKMVNISPEEVSSEILKYLKDSASQFLGFDITEAVVSVPAHFSIAQRKATKRAAELAGLKVLKLVCEPVAAAIHYSMDKLKTKTTLLVFDFGGGTLDVSVIEVDNQTFEVKGIVGDSFLGGRDFDKKLLTSFIQEALLKVYEKGDRRINEHLLRVKKKCTTLKILLSVRNEISIHLDHFGRNEDEMFSLTVSRTEFEILCEDLFARATDLVRECLDDLEKTINDIDEVLLVGGTTRIPKVKEMLRLYFNDKELKTDLNPDEAVALGAAIQAAILKNNCIELEKYKVTDITPLTLGFRLNGGLMKVAIEKNTPLPAKSTVIQTSTSKNNQKTLDQAIYEGERKNCKFNVLLATLHIDNLPLARAGDISFDTVFSLDEDGLLEVESSELATGNKNKIVVTMHEHRLSQKKIRSTLAEAQQHKEEDIVFERLCKLRRKVRKYCNYILYDLDKILNSGQRNNVERNCNKILQYSDDVDNINIDELGDKFVTMKKIVEPIISDKIPIIFDAL